MPADPDRPPPPSDAETPPGGPPDADAEAAENESALEEAARARFGMGPWDRGALFRETAAAAAETGLPFWAVLMLSGAIATLGLALDASAVVIGAMLIAPLLGPVLGLAMALAVGDGRLAAQTGLTILLGVVAVVAVAAGLTALLPFHTVTSEILARTQPTTLDLAIAVCSGLAGAVVTLAREKRLSAAIPGVAIAVALIPPLGVAGFGVGTGWQWPLIRGSMLLFGANLGGIVLSGMLAFLLVGMHRPAVVEAARTWHRNGPTTGLAGSLARVPLFRRLRVFASPWARVGLVLAFVVAVAVPLSTSLRQFVRESRVTRAVSAAAAALDATEQTSILGRSVRLSEDGARVQLRVATSAWISEARRSALERQLSADAGEPVTLLLEQLPASAGNLDALAAMLPGAGAEPAAAPSFVATVGQLHAQVLDALGGLALPDSVRGVGASLAFADGPPQLRVAYAAPRALPAEAEAMLTRQAALALGLAPEVVTAETVSLAPRPLPADPAALAEAAALLRRYPSLRLVVTADSAAGAGVHARLTAAGAPTSALVLERGPEPGAPGTLRFVAPDSTAGPR